MSERDPGDAPDSTSSGSASQDPPPSSSPAADEARQADSRTPAEVAQEQAVPGASTDQERAEILVNRGVDRGLIVGEAVGAASVLAVRVLILGVFAFSLLWVIGQFWVAVFPILLALILATVLWPPTRWMRSKGVPAALAAAVSLLGFFGLIIGLFTAIAPSVVSQASDLSDTAVEGVSAVQEWVQGPPLNLDSDKIDQYTQQATSWLQGNGQSLLTSALSGVGVLTNGLVAFALVVVLTFFFIKDGPRFLPWLRRLTGRTAGRHLTELSMRSWNTLGGFIRAQATVAAVDAVLIGIGLLVLGVPLAIPLAILTFLGGFIPIVGAVSIGALSVLVALVSNGPTTALFVLALILIVQQIEGNVLSPYLQGSAMQLHAGIILLAVTVGGTLFGISGAFLAVPVAAVLAVLIRYGSEQLDLRSGDVRAADLPMTTPEGAVAAERAEETAEVYRERYAGHIGLEEPASTAPGAVVAAERAGEEKVPASPSEQQSQPFWRRLLGR